MLKVTFQHRYIDDIWVWDRQIKVIDTIVGIYYSDTDNKSLKLSVQKPLD